MADPNSNGTGAAVDVTAPLLEFIRGLDKSFEQRPDNIAHNREQLATALSVVGQFLSKIDPAHANYFFDLGTIFADLNAGARHPLIVPAKRKTARPIPSEIEAAKASVAFALEALIVLGEAPQKAAETILKLFPKIEYLAGPKSRKRNTQKGKGLKDTILEWRKFLRSARRKKNDTATDVFAAGRELINRWKLDRPAELRKRALGRAKLAESVAKRHLGIL
jgi:hypothetical protein